MVKKGGNGRLKKLGLARIWYGIWKRYGIWKQTGSLGGEPAVEVNAGVNEERRI